MDPNLSNNAVYEALHSDDTLILAGPACMDDLRDGEMMGHGGAAAIGLFTAFRVEPEKGLLVVTRPAVNGRSLSEALSAGRKVCCATDGTVFLDGEFGLAFLMRRKNGQVVRGTYYGNCVILRQPRVMVNAGSPQILETVDVEFRTTREITPESAPALAALFEDLDPPQICTGTVTPPPPLDPDALYRNAMEAWPLRARRSIRMRTALRHGMKRAFG